MSVATRFGAHMALGQWSIVEQATRPSDGLGCDGESRVTIKRLQHLVAQLGRPGCEPACLSNRVGDREAVVDGDIC